jgi:hypothetical protein
MTTERVYALALAVAEAMAEPTTCCWSQFWPKGIDLVVEVASEEAVEPTLV